MDDTIHFSRQITRNGDRMKDYYTRNKKLIRTYFSPSSLIKIFNYYQKSRMVYGMNSDMVQKETAIRLRQNLIQMIKQILGMDYRCNNKRIQLALAIPDLTSKLVVQLIKNLYKLKRYFGITTDL
jgi:hypothetical protein